MLGVQVLSIETIKPSSPTARHLHSLPLSLLDQTACRIFNHNLLFYSPADDDHEMPTSKSFKSSLSQTLVHFYPLAGRIKASKDGTLHVACDDEGAVFAEARVEGTSLDAFLKDPSVIDGFPELLVIKASSFELDDPLVGVQITTFECGGLAVGLSISHVIADAASMCLFQRAWADVTRGLAVQPEPRFDAASVLPPQPFPVSMAKESWQTPASGEARIAIRRFTMAAADVERLRGGGREARRRPTRVVAVSALAWRCMVRARGETVCAMTLAASLHAVNLRRRMSPKLSDESFGNLWVSASASGPTIGETTMASMVAGENNWLFEESIMKAMAEVGEEYAKKKAEEKLKGVDTGSDPWVFSSTCGMPFYNVDFGLGGPVWVGCALRDMKDVCILVDARDGKGIEVWLWLKEEEMQRVERDPEFLKYVSHY